MSGGVINQPYMRLRGLFKYPLPHFKEHNKKVNSLISKLTRKEKLTSEEAQMLADYDNEEIGEV